MVRFWFTRYPVGGFCIDNNLVVPFTSKAAVGCNMAEVLTPSVSMLMDQLRDCRTRRLAPSLRSYMTRRRRISTRRGRRCLSMTLSCVRACAESPGGFSPPGAPKTVRDLSIHTAPNIRPLPYGVMSNGRRVLVWNGVTGQTHRFKPSWYQHRPTTRFCSSAIRRIRCRPERADDFFGFGTSARYRDVRGRLAHPDAVCEQLDRFC